MIYSIMPLVQEAGHNFRRAAVYSFALVVTAVSFFTGLAVAGHQITIASPGLSILAVVMLAYAVREIGRLRLPLPSSHWQVPRSWINLGPTKGAVLYGVMMGAGFFTRAPFGTYHALLLWSFVAGSPLLGAGTGLAFGLARALTLMLPRLQREGGHVQRTEVIYRRAEQVHVLNGVVLALAGSTVLVVSLTELV